MIKKVLLNTFKILFAIGIITWLLKNDKLDPREALKIFTSPYILITAIPLFLIQLVLLAKRWQFLLQTKSKKITDTKRILAIHWIGLFFSSTLPGAVTGDLIKLSYIKKMDDNISTKFLILSVFLDRLLGLISLLLISGFSSIIYYNDLVNLSPEMPKIILINLLLLVCSLMGIGLFFIKASWIKVMQGAVRIKKINNILEGLKSVQLDKFILLKLLIMSLVIHFLSFLIFDIINHNSYEFPIRIRDLATIIPLGMISVVVPISPSGLGVGHLAYQKLFSFINHSNGATLFNNFWIFYLLMNLVGVVPYIFFKNKKDI